MIERALDQDGDWTFGIGKNNYLTSQAAIAQDIKTRLLEFTNDCFFNLGAGIDWNNLLGSPGAVRSEAQILLSCRAVILQTYGVVKVNTLTATVDSARSVSIQGDIDTIFTTKYNFNLQGAPYGQ